MTINLKSLQNRILIRFIFLLMITIMIILFVTLEQTYRHSENQINKQFSIARLVFSDKLTNHSRALYRSISPISKDFTLKQLVNDATNDPASLLSAVNNQQRRIKTDFSAILSSDAKTIVSNISSTSTTWPVKKISQTGINILVLNNIPYLVRAVPIRLIESSAKINAWLVMGIKIKKMINDDLKSILGFDVTLLINNMVEVSTYPALIRKNNKLASQAFVNEIPSSDRENISFQGESLALYQFVINNNDSYKLTAIFTIDKDLAFINFTNLASQLIIAIGVIILITVFLSFRFSISIAKPLKKLVNIAHEIQRGNYVEITHDAHVSEVNKLSFALSNMQGAIQQREKDNHQLVFYSVLTGLPNRNHFIQTMNELIDDATQQFAVILMDIDRFKEINDTLGHEYGDQVLQAIAKRLHENVVQGAYVAYLDGDEFAMLIPCPESIITENVVAQVIDIFDPVFEINNIQLDVSTSMGIAMYPEDSIKADGLMQFADIALYVCKDKHSSYELYNGKFNTHSILRLNLMSELRSSLDNGHLQLHYQPQIDIATNQVKSLECLVRWQHPEHGFIYPDDFIPLAEQTGNIRYLTTWAIEEALKQHNKLKANGFHIHMAVNISAIDLTDSDLVEFVKVALEKHNVVTNMLMLEVTESAIMSDPEKAITVLTKLKDMGVQLSIDDFGTGYSSMEQLKRTPVNELKIDKSFVLELISSNEDAIIVKSITDLAHNLGLSVVAEGVENKESLEILHKIGVETAQGYFISKAIHADDFLPWLLNYEKTNINA
ncbi:MAG: diguanylate cyclase (GGDEF)-like protein [Colwellia sp.]|jgi:diguanylate cyclase (GGDEF)-like protein